MSYASWMILGPLTRNDQALARAASVSSGEDQSREAAAAAPLESFSGEVKTGRHLKMTTIIIRAAELRTTAPEAFASESSKWSSMSAERVVLRGIIAQKSLDNCDKINRC